jgi:Tfp pilus assembly protein PilF
LEEWIDGLKDGDSLSDAQFTEALAEFDKALVVDPTCLDAYLGRAYVLGLKNDQEGGTK